MHFPADSADTAGLLRVSVTKPAANDARVECEHAETCGGCPLIGLAYGEQLAMKRGRLVQSLSRYASLELVYTEPVQPAEPVAHYRTRAKLIAGRGGRLGLYAKGGGHHLVDIPGCQVLAPVLARLAEMLRARIYADEASNGPLTPFDGVGSGTLRAIDLREIRDPDDGASKVLVTLVVQRATRAGAAAASLDGLRAVAQSLLDTFPEILGVAANLHDGEAPQILGSDTQHLAGKQSASDRMGGSVHLATFGSFVQAHRGQAERVHQALNEQIEQLRGNTYPDDATDAGAGKHKMRVLDLYGGSGAIALSLSAAGADVHLVESFAPAVAHAEAAAAAQGLSLTAECGDVSTVLRGILDRGERFDAIVVNPPRRGMSSVAREWLARMQAPLIAYVSCDPDTLARDLDHLTRLGYAAPLLRPLDMIPLTDEVETIAFLRRVPLAAPKVVYEDDDVIFVDKAPHEPTVAQGEYAHSLVDRVRRLPGAESAVPVHRIDIGTSGLVLLVRDPARVAAWQNALAAVATRKIYVAAARGVTPAKGAITRELREDGKLYAARTRYRRLAVASGHSVLRIIPEQGRTHQIRRHLSAIGHPVLGDDRYGHPPTNRFFEEKNGLDRPFLHCVRIEIDHPLTGARLIVEAPLPGDLRAVLERTSGPGTLRFLDHKAALGTSGLSTIPPPPDSMHSSGSVLDVDASSPTVYPPMINDDDRDDRGF